MDLLPSLFSLSILWAVPSGHHEYTAASTTACTAIHEITSSTSRCLLWFWILLSCWLLWSSSSICSLFLLFLSSLLLAVFSSFWARFLLLLLLIKQRRKGLRFGSSSVYANDRLGSCLPSSPSLCSFPSSCLLFSRAAPPASRLNTLFIYIIHTLSFGGGGDEEIGEKATEKSTRLDFFTQPFFVQWASHQFRWK